jgi:hypothetical protein
MINNLVNLHRHRIRDMPENVRSFFKGLAELSQTYDVYVNRYGDVCGNTDGNRLECIDYDPTSKEYFCHWINDKGSHESSQGQGQGQ